MRKPTRNRLDINALEARLACHRQTIWRWYTTRDFPSPHYLGQKRLWWEDEVEAWENKEIGADPSDGTEASNTDSFLTMSGSSPPDTINGEGGAE
jgi:predicted DNA-binding transcriptional regulator AlpA